EETTGVNRHWGFRFDPVANDWVFDGKTVVFDGRTGDRFMSLAKTGQISNCCLPNALITLKEYLLDYAKPATVAAGEKVITAQLSSIPNLTARKKAEEFIDKMIHGERDFRF
ncbi:MAG: hypothetical protein RR060_09040, partial [Victivallaceae bacterium]